MPGAKTPPVQVIINADDLGMNPKVNAAVFDLMARGKIASATVMANGLAAKEAAAELHHFPKCSFGVHLNLTEFSPFTNSPALERILASAEAGQPRTFGPRGTLVQLSKSDSYLRDAIFEEWSAQIQHLLSLGVPVSHIDSHHHTHSIPWLFGPLKRVQKRFGIRKVRISLNLFSESDPPKSTLLRLQKAVWNTAVRHLHHTKTTDAFTSFETFRSVYKPVAKNIPWFESIELMTHPGGPQFAAETALLEDPWQNDLGFETGLCSYNDL